MPLLVCATPIGNLEDVTYRVVRELGAADLVLCEDTRRTRVLLAHYRLSPRLLRYERHVEARRTAEVLPLLEAGQRVALVSDAGLPAVNDPGARLIASAVELGVDVTVLPGPSAVETALVASGLIADRYVFLGYVPRGATARQKLLNELDRWGAPVVAFESPHRLPSTLAALAEVDPARPVAVCRELTKRFEEVVRGAAAELATRFREPPRGEITLVVGALAASPVDRAAEERAATAVAALVAEGVSRRRAAHIVSDLVEVPSNRLYRSSL